MSHSSKGSSSHSAEHSQSGHSPITSSSHSPDVSLGHTGTISTAGHNPLPSVNHGSPSSTLHGSELSNAGHNPTNSSLHDSSNSGAHSPAASTSGHYPIDSSSHLPHLSQQHNSAVSAVGHQPGQSPLHGASRSAELSQQGRLGSILGVITLQARTATLPQGVGYSIAQVTLDPSGVTLNVVNDGRFLLSDILPGSYTLTASAPGYVSAERTDVVIEPGVTLVVPVVQLRAGLVNDDLVVDDADLNATTASFGALIENRVDAQGRIVDLNGDGLVNVQDVNAVVSNLGMTSPQPWE